MFMSFISNLKKQVKISKVIYRYSISKQINPRRNKHLYFQITVFEMSSTLCLVLAVNSIFTNVMYVTML